MSWLSRCNACRGGGFYCPHLNPDLNQAAPGFPHGGGCPGVVLQEFQFLGQDGAVAWLLDDADPGEQLEPPEAAPPTQQQQLVAPAYRPMEWVGSPCSPPRRPAFSVYSSSGRLRESTPKSPTVDVSLVEPATSVGAAVSDSIDPLILILRLLNLWLNWVLINLQQHVTCVRTCDIYTYIRSIPKL